MACMSVYMYVLHIAVIYNTVNNYSKCMYTVLTLDFTATCKLHTFSRENHDDYNKIPYENRQKFRQ